MQVLEHGSKAPIITCSCGCKFLYENSDIVTTKDGEIETKTVTCPECGESYRIDCAEYSTKLRDTIHVQCPWCEYEVDYCVAGYGVSNTYQIVTSLC